MKTLPSYVVVTPARDEVRHIEATLAAVGTQTFAATYFARPVVERLLQMPDTGSDSAKEVFGGCSHSSCGTSSSCACPQATPR